MQNLIMGNYFFYLIKIFTTSIHIPLETRNFPNNFLASDSFSVVPKTIAEYADAKALQDAHQQQINGNQPEDPQKASEVLIKVAEDENPPLHLFPGQDVYDMAKIKIEAVETDLTGWEAIATKTGFELEAV